MFPYQIYQALSDQRMRELSAEARHHEMVAVARLARRERAESRYRLRHATARTLALLRFLRGAGADSTVSARAAGPMGCSA